MARRKSSYASLLRDIVEAKDLNQFSSCFKNISAGNFLLALLHERPDTPNVYV